MEPAPTRAAAAVVKQRGVSVHIYGPLADRKREVYLLAYHVGSRREKQTVKGTLADAQRKAKEVANSISAGDVVDGLHLTPLDRRVYLTAKEAAARVGRPVDAICRESTEALLELGPGATLMEAVRFWKKHHSGELPAAMPDQVVEELFAWLAGKRRSAVTLKSLRVLYRKFTTAFQMPIAHITRDDLDRWLAAQIRLSPRSVRNLRAALVQLFNFAKGKYLPHESKSAAELLDLPSDDNRGSVQIFRPWEMERLLQCAPPTLLPCLALGAFAGLRTIELCRLEWSAIHFSEDLPAGEVAAQTAFPHGFIVVDKAVAKQHRTAARRIIPMQANLAAWLEPFRFREGVVSPKSADWKLSAAITDLISTINAKEKKAHRREISRPKNGLRHSFGSYRLPVIESVAALSLEMNNSPREIIENYRELVMPRDVEAWWKIAPREPARVIQFDLFG